MQKLRTSRTPARTRARSPRRTTLPYLAIRTGNTSLPAKIIDANANRMFENQSHQQNLLLTKVYHPMLRAFRSCIQRLEEID